MNLRLDTFPAAHRRAPTTTSMISSTLKPPITFRDYPQYHAKIRPVGSNTDHQKRLRDADAQRKQSSIHKGMVVTVSTGHDSFCSSIGDLAYDGEGSSRQCLFTSECEGNQSDICAPQASLIAENSSESQQMDLTAQKGLPSPDVDKPQDDQSALPTDNPETVREFCGSEDQRKSVGKSLEKQAQVKEEIVVPLSSRWRRTNGRQDGEHKRMNTKPIQRVASLSPVKRVRNKVLAHQPLQLSGSQDLGRPTDIVSDRRSRSEGEVITSRQEAHRSTLRRNRSTGDRRFQFLQRIKGKRQNSTTKDVRAMVHACETDKIMNHIAGHEYPLPSNSPLTQRKLTIPAISRRPTLLLQKQRSKSLIGSSELLEMAQCVSPASTKQPCGSESIAHVREAIPEFQREEVTLASRRRYRPLKKQRSKSLLPSTDLLTLEADLPQTTRFVSPMNRSSSKLGERCLPVPPSMARRAVSMTAIDCPPRLARRGQSGRTPPPAASRSFDGYLARKKDEDWQIASLDEDSVTSANLNSETVCPLNTQEEEMILLALERSLEDSGSSPPPSHSSPMISSPPKDLSPPLCSNETLFWIKEDSFTWVALPGVPFANDTSTADNEMLEMVLRSSAKDTMTRVHLQLLGAKRPSDSMDYVTHQHH